MIRTGRPDSPAPDLDDKLSRLVSEILGSDSESEREEHTRNDAKKTPSPFDDSEDDPNYEPEFDNSGIQNLLQRKFSHIASENAPLDTPSTASPSGSITRKRKKNYSAWKRNVKRKLRESGKEYTNDRGEKHRARTLQPVKCEAKCSLECTKKFAESDRKEINALFWSLSDNEKNYFYGQFVERLDTKRKRTKSENSKKKFSYKYFLQSGQKRIRVCQTFFLSTIDVSKNRIYYFFKKKYDGEKGVPIASNKGKHVKKAVPAEQVAEVKAHINSFPVKESHYCRSTSQKQYLEAGLSISKMYKLYLEKAENPVKLHKYIQIFNEEFNLSFFRPKKDLCDKCVKFKSLENPTEYMTDAQNKHLAEKVACRQEKQKDKNSTLEKHVMVSFDFAKCLCITEGKYFKFLL